MGVGPSREWKAMVAAEYSDIARRMACKDQHWSVSWRVIPARQNQLIKLLTENQQSIDKAIRQKVELLVQNVEVKSVVEEIMNMCGTKSAESRKALTNVVSLGLAAAPSIACCTCWVVLEALFGPHGGERSVLEQVNQALQSRDYRTFKADLDFAKNQIREACLLEPDRKAKKASEVDTLLDKLFWQVNALLDETQNIKELELMHMIAHLRLHAIMLQAGQGRVLENAVKTYKATLLQKSHIYGRYRRCCLTWEVMTDDPDIPDCFPPVRDLVAGTSHGVPYHQSHWYMYTEAWEFEMAKLYRDQVDKTMEETKGHYDTFMSMALEYQDETDARRCSCTLL